MPQIVENVGAAGPGSRYDGIPPAECLPNRCWRLGHNRKTSRYYCVLHRILVASRALPDIALVTGGPGSFMSDATVQSHHPIYVSDMYVSDPPGGKRTEWVRVHIRLAPRVFPL